MRRMRSSANIKMTAAANPAPTALLWLNPNGCQAQESAATAATNTARTIQELVPPASGKSEFFLFSADDASALRAEECATSLFVRLIRPHRIPNHCKIEQPAAEGMGAATQRRDAYN